MCLPLRHNAIDHPLTQLEPEVSTHPRVDIDKLLSRQQHLTASYHTNTLFHMSNLYPGQSTQPKPANDFLGRFLRPYDVQALLTSCTGPSSVASLITTHNPRHFSRARFTTKNYLFMT